jgi:hypothetical protein
MMSDLLPLDDEDFGGAYARATDGSLLFLDASHHALRALVPPDSPRPRIVVTQAGFASLGKGRIRFWASRPGAVTATVGRGGAEVVHARGDAVAVGDGALALQSLPAGRYVLRLRLTTPSGGVAETLEHVDTRRVLQRRVAIAVLKGAFEDSDGDEGGGEANRVHNCRRRSPRVISCLLRYHLSTNEFEDPEPWRWSDVSLPSARLTATLHADGIHTNARLLPGGYDTPEASLRVHARRHQDASDGLITQVRAVLGASVRVAAHLRWRAGGQLHRTIQVRTRDMRAATTWRIAIPLPDNALAAVRAGRHVTGEIIVRATHPARTGPVREEHGFPLVVHR